MTPTGILDRSLEIDDEAPSDFGREDGAQMVG